MDLDPPSGGGELLAAERTSLKGEVRFLFQHAEELPPGGAVEICHILGKEETLRRLRVGMDMLK